MAYEVHPVADIFPMVEGESLQSMVEDIRANGLLEPIILQGNVILDGRNRLKACELAGVTPRYREVDSSISPEQYILSHNLHRRHLTVQQRAIVAAKLANLAHGTNQFAKKEGGSLKKEEVSNDTSSPEAANQWVSQNDAPSPAPSTTLEEAAEKLGVSRSSTVRARKLIKENPEEAEAILRGEKPANKPKPSPASEQTQQPEEEPDMTVELVVKRFREEDEVSISHVIGTQYKEQTGRIPSHSTIESIRKEVEKAVTITTKKALVKQNSELETKIKKFVREYLRVKVVKPSIAMTILSFMYEQTGVFITNGTLLNLKENILGRLSWTVQDKEILSEEQIHEINEVLYEYLLENKIVEPKKEESAEEAAAALEQKEVSKLERAIKAHKRELDAQFEQRVKEHMETVLEMYSEEYDRYKAFNDSYSGVFADDEYKLLISVLHPDRCPPEQAQRYAKAFHLVKSKEEILCKVKPASLTPTSMPRTLSELIKRRKH